MTRPRRHEPGEPAHEQIGTGVQQPRRLGHRGSRHRLEASEQARSTSPVGEQVDEIEQDYVRTLRRRYRIGHGIETLLYALVIMVLGNFVGHFVEQDDWARTALGSAAVVALLWLYWVKQWPR